MLAIVWFGFFLLAFSAGIYQWLVLGNDAIFTHLVQSTFEMAALSVEIALGLVGVLCLWLGVFRIGERAGLINLLARGLSPLFQRLMPEVPPGHPALGGVTLNLAANFLGLDNAATPMGLKAMRDLQTLNLQPSTANNAQILFLVLNTSSVTLLPVTIFLYRAQQGATDPAAVFIPILLATTASTFTGLFAVAWIQKLQIFDKVVLGYFGAFTVLLSGFIAYLSALPPAELAQRSSLLGNLALMTVIMLFLSAGVIRKVNVYEAFIEGAKEGFEVAVNLIPFLVAMLVAIGLLRTSGVLDAVLTATEAVVRAIGLNTDFIQALPTALMKPFSGSGSRALMLETMNSQGVDSFPATLAAIMQGSTETTFYVLTVYFGSVGIVRVRHALACGLLADAAGISSAILVGYWFFH